MAPIWWDYQFGFELLIVNGLITFLGLYLFSKSNPNQPANKLPQKKQFKL